MLPDYLRARYNTPSVVLCVDKGNPGALKLYLAHGWVATGEVHNGRSGPAPVLLLAL